MPKATTVRDVHQSNPDTGRPSAAFSTLFTAADMDKLLGNMHWRHVTKGHCLYWDGDAEDHLYYLRKGCVRIVKSSECGGSLTVALMGPGDFFGLADPFRDATHQFSALTMTECEVGAISRDRLAVLLSQHADLSVRFFRWMSLCQRIALTKVRDLTLYGKQGALASVLLRLANTYGVPEGADTRIGLRLSNAELAQMIGSTRETVNRMLCDMKREGTLSVRGGFLVIHNAEALRGVCRCDRCPADVCRM